MTQTTTIRYGLNSVEVTPRTVKIRKGLRTITINREALLGLESKPLTGKVVFITAKKRYKVTLYHGLGKIREELNL